MITSFQKPKRLNRKLIVIVVLIAVILAAAAIGFYVVKVRPSQSSNPKQSNLASADEQVSKVYEPLRERTQTAYDKLSSVLPYQDPEGNFAVKYFSGSRTFSVSTGAKTWEEYAEKRIKAADFFRGKGVDPCNTHIVWGSDPSLLSKPMPKGLDFGCPLSINR